MKTKGTKHRKDSSSSSESGSESDNSSSSSTPEKVKDKKHSKSTKSSKSSKKGQYSDESDHKDTKSKLKKEETDTSKWDSPVTVENTKSGKHDRHKEDQRPKQRNSDEEHTSRKTDRHEEDRGRDRHNQRKDSRQRDRSHEGRSREGRHRNDNSRNRGSHEDKRQQNAGRRSRERSPFRDNRDNRRNYNNKEKYSKRRRSNSPDANYAWGKSDGQGDSKQQSNAAKAEKEKPNFQLSGKLTEETNTYRGVVIKYSEPPDARKPKRRWRLYPFKGEKAMQTLYIHRQSAYLMGRDRKIVDLPIDHPSCSKQHAVLQYRLVPFERDDGSSGKRVRPYIIDLESANGTFINNNKIDPKKYVELLEKDVLKFGYSSREYVLLHENSKDEAQDDDVKQEEEEVNIKEEPKDE